MLVENSQNKQLLININKKDKMSNTKQYQKSKLYKSK